MVGRNKAVCGMKVSDAMKEERRKGEETSVERVELLARSLKDGKMRRDVSQRDPRGRALKNR